MQRGAPPRARESAIEARALRNPGPRDDALLEEVLGRTGLARRCADGNPGTRRRGRGFARSGTRCEPRTRQGRALAPYHRKTPGTGSR
eukprot:5481147-Alexandrium_andersonii.AAC.1